MKSERKALFKYMTEIFNLVMITMPVAYGWLYFYYPEVPDGSDLIRWSVIGIFMFMYLIYSNVYDAFQIEVGKISDIVYSQALSALVSDAVIYLIILLLTREFPSPLIWLVIILVQVYLMTVWAFMVCRLYFSAFEPNKTLVVYDQRRKLEELITNYGFDRKFKVEAVVSADYFLKHYSDEFTDIDTIFLSGISSQKKNELIKFCMVNQVTVFLIPYIGDVLMNGSKPVNMFHLPVLELSHLSLHPIYAFEKRLLDILISSIMLVFTSPILIGTAIAIKLDDHGPVFYKQVRLTKDGKRYKIIKFRSMRTDSEKDGKARLSTGDNDDRITKVGHFIRKVRIDELPQLFNILGGSMTIVGPRPERPELTEQYKQTLPEFDLRLQVKAGLTGYAQVYGKYNTTPYDKLQMDLMYITSCGIMEDLRIIFATVKILFLPESTEGVAVGQTTAMDEDMEEVMRRG